MNTRLLLILPLTLLAAGIMNMSAQADSNIMRLASVVVENHAEKIFHHSGAIGMSLVVVDNDQVVTRNYGEIRPGSGIRPNKDSLIRIASITKLMTSQVMVKMAAEGKVNVTDPLNRYVPDYAASSPIRLYHLATHTSGLPREQPGRPAQATVFTWPTENARLRWLKKAKLTTPPGTQAVYSNLAYDLLADALANAAKKPYPVLFREKITQPLGMRDTTYTPTTEQCARLMIGKGSGPCKNAIAAIGSGGVYSTPQDMQIWMQQFFDRRRGHKTSTLVQERKVYFNRHQLTSLKGMDVAGQADGLGLGWVLMQPTPDRVGMLQKTGGAGGFITYMAIVPEKNIGVFVVMTRGEKTRFRTMSDGVNKLITDLVRTG